MNWLGFPSIWAQPSGQLVPAPLDLSLIAAGNGGPRNDQAYGLLRFPDSVGKVARAKQSKNLPAGARANRCVRIPGPISHSIRCPLVTPTLAGKFFGGRE